MTYTSHGHHIPGTTKDDELAVTRARCGGPAICTVCQKESNLIHKTMTGESPSQFFEDISEYAENPDRFLEQAKLFVVGARNNTVDDTTEQLSVNDLYIVWFTKTLGNWKALISTSIPGDNLYFEVTHNGDKEETYVDTYLKISNDKFSQEGQ